MGENWGGGIRYQRNCTYHELLPCMYGHRAQKRKTNPSSESSQKATLRNLSIYIIKTHGKMQIAAYYWATKVYHYSCKTRTISQHKCITTVVNRELFLIWKEFSHALPGPELYRLLLAVGKIQNGYMVLNTRNAFQTHYYFPDTWILLETQGILALPNNTVGRARR